MGVFERRDIVDIAGIGAAGGASGDAGGRGGSEGGPAGRKWLGVMYKCCGVYGRMYQDEAGARYSGRCPRCLAEVSAKVGEGGTSRRFFEAS